MGLYFYTVEKLTFITILGSFSLCCEGPWKTFLKASGYPVTACMCLLYYHIAKLFGFHNINITATILISSPCHPVFPRSLQCGFTGLEEAAGGKSFNYANMKIIKGGAYQIDLMKALTAFQYLLLVTKLNFRLYLVRGLQHLNK